MAAELNALYGVAVDADGNIFIAGTTRIREVDQLTGLITTVAGGNVAGFSAIIIQPPRPIEFPSGHRGGRGDGVAFSSPIRTTIEFADLRVGKDAGVEVVVATIHAPTVTNAVTGMNTQTNSGLVITPNLLDVGVVDDFQITGIAGGTLYLNNGVTPVTDGEFITAAQGAAGLKFTPTANSLAQGSFTVQASTAASARRKPAYPPVAATITVLPSTTTTIVASSNLIYTGTGVNPTAYVSSAITPTDGSVTFMDGATTVGTAPVNSGLAVLSDVVLPVGANTITANYSGDETNWAAEQRERCAAPIATITTVAGDGSGGFTGDGVQATAATLDLPEGVAVGCVRRHFHR